MVGAAFIGTGHCAKSCSYIHATVAVIYMPTAAVILTGYYADNYFPPLGTVPPVAAISKSPLANSCKYIFFALWQQLQLYPIIAAVAKQLSGCPVGITAAASTVPIGYNCSC